VIPSHLHLRTESSTRKRQPENFGRLRGYGSAQNTGADTDHLYCKSRLEQEEAMLLSRVEKGQRVRLLGVNAGHGLRERLASLGLIPGVEVEVLNNSYKAPVIVALNGNRIMLGRGMAQKIAVE
jgi:Fe2+ transport system protein FeoA